MTKVVRGELLHKGKVKSVFETNDPDLVIIDFTDEVTAFDGEKRGIIKDKGLINAAITELCFSYLEQHGIGTHLVSRLSDRELLAKKVEIIPVEVVMRNIAAGSMTKRLGIPSGTELKQPVAELFYKDDDLGDPLMNHEHVYVMELAEPHEVEFMVSQARKINELLCEYFDRAGLILVDFKLEFGRLSSDPNTIVLGDELSPDSCRFWDKETRRKLDKDLFRRSESGVDEAYQEVYRRVTDI